MKVSYRTKYLNILSPELVAEIKLLRKIGKGDLSDSELEELRGRIIQNSLDLRLKKESVAAIARSQLGIKRNGDIPKGRLDDLTIKAIQQASVAGFRSIHDSDGKYWLSNPQRYDANGARIRFKEQVAKYGLGCILLRGWRKSVDFEFVYPPLAIEAPNTVRERILDDLNWMLENQCTLGVCLKDLSHGHICYLVGKDGQYPSSDLNEANQRVEELISADLTLGTTKVWQSRYYRDFKEASHKLNQVVASDGSMNILYHTLEHTNHEHPFYVNRTVLSSNSERVCIIPTHGQLGISADEIDGISELRVRFYLRINPYKGKSNTDLSNLEVYIAPLIGKL
jgi:hypothetical protein